MYLSGFNLFLADAAPAATNGAPAAQQPGSLNFIFLMAIFVVMIYFLMFRPQSQQRKKQMQLLEALKSGDKIVTSSGIVGVVITVKDKTVSLRSMDAKMEVTKSSIVEILEGDGEIKSDKSA